MEKPTWAQPGPDLCAELEERLRFETLLANLSARFVNVPLTTSTPKLSTYSAAFASASGLTSKRSGSTRPGNTRHFRADSLLSTSGGAFGSRPHVAERRRPVKEGSSAYKPTQVHRKSVMTFEKGKPVFILDDPQGTPWVIQAFSDMVHSNLIHDQLEELGDKLNRCLAGSSAWPT